MRKLGKRTKMRHLDKMVAKDRQKIEQKKTRAKKNSKVNQKQGKLTQEITSFMKRELIKKRTSK